MKIILLIFLLNIQSSYLQNFERETFVPADTVQFLLVGNDAWRIKTFAVDHDVHVYSLGKVEREKFEEVAINNTRKHYGDVIHQMIRVESSDTLLSLRPKLKNAGLAENLEISKDGKFAFWVSEPDVYVTKSVPMK